MGMIVCKSRRHFFGIALEGHYFEFKNNEYMTSDAKQADILRRHAGEFYEVVSDFVSEELGVRNEELETDAGGESMHNAECIMHNDGNGTELFSGVSQSGKTPRQASLATPLIEGNCPINPTEPEVKTEVRVGGSKGSKSRKG